jgi:hypothetical protein
MCRELNYRENMSAGRNDVAEDVCREGNSGESESESFGRLSARESDYVRDRAKATRSGQSCMPVSSDEG